MEQAQPTVVIDSIPPPFREAQYRPDPDADPRLRGNPMADVWPRPSDDVYAKLRKRFDARGTDFLDKPLEQRIELLDRLDDFHYPFEGEVGSLRKVVSQVRKSYIPRNPKDPLVMRALMSAAEGRFTPVPRMSETGGGGGLGLLVTGISGSGKSSWADRLQYLFGQRPWVHKQLDGRPCRWYQLGGIRVKAKRTWKSTLEAIIQVIDFQLGTDYFSKRERSATNGRYENSVLAAATGHFAPYLILEDLDRIETTDGDKSKEILDGLVDLMESAGLVVVVVGTVKLRRLFMRDPTYFAKFSSAGQIRFEPLQNSRDADLFIRSLQSQSVSKTPITYCDDFEHQLLLSTMGVRRIMRETMRCILTRHAHEESIVVDAKLLADIAKNELDYFQDCVGVLRQYNLGMPASFQDYQAYEHYLPPEAVRLTTEQQAVVDKFRADKALNLNAVRGALTLDIYEALKTEQDQVLINSKDKPGTRAKKEAGAKAKSGSGSDFGLGAPPLPAEGLVIPKDLDPATLG